MSTLTEQFLAEIEAFLVANEMDPTKFGRSCLNDPNFVFDLRKGDRSPSAKTIDRVRAFMASYIAEPSSKKSEAA